MSPAGPNPLTRAPRARAPGDRPETKRRGALPLTAWDRHGVAPFWPGRHLSYIAKRPMIIAPDMTPSVLLYLRALVFYTGVLTTLCVFAPLA